MLHRKLLMFACLSFPLAAMAAPDAQARALRLQIAALQLDHALNLTPQQAKTLLPLLQSAQAQAQALKTQRAASEPARVAALTQAVADLKAHGAVSDATAQAVKAAQVSRKPLGEDLRTLWQQAKVTLTPDQLQALKTVHLGIAPGGSEPPPQHGQHGRGARFARGHRVVRAVLSDAFISLVQARAG